MRLRGYVYPPEPLVSSSTAAAALTGMQGGTDDVQDGTANGYEEIYALYGEMPHGFFLNEPVSIRVTFEGTEFVAEQPRLEVHAFGDSAIEAVGNLRQRVAEHYQCPQALSNRWSPRMG